MCLVFDILKLRARFSLYVIIEAEVTIGLSFGRVFSEKNYWTSILKVQISLDSIEATKDGSAVSNQVDGYSYADYQAIRAIQNKQQSI